MYIAKTLAKLQKEADMNLTQLSIYTGLSRSTISRVLSHKSDRSNRNYNPSFRTVRQIAQSLGVSSDEVFTTKMDVEIEA